jgi:hypothetical protein
VERPQRRCGTPTARTGCDPCSSVALRKAGLGGRPESEANHQPCPHRGERRDGPSAIPARTSADTRPAIRTGSSS